MSRIGNSELIINSDGSIYHLHVKPGDLAGTIFTVGDQNRVEMVSRYFDEILYQNQYREFKSVTGLYKGLKLSVLSTGIGIDNIDIILNEVDALFNIDFESRKIKEHRTAVNFIRLGTSGCLQKEIPIDSILVSEFGIEMNALLKFYNYKQSEEENHISKAISPLLEAPLSVTTSKASSYLLNKLSEGMHRGITYSALGFYGPQGRELRLSSFLDKKRMDSLSDISVSGLKITNIEMETAVLYGLSRLLGHRAISFNALLANRPLRQFSDSADKTVDEMIRLVLDRLTKV